MLAALPPLIAIVLLARRTSPLVSGLAALGCGIALLTVFPASPQRFWQAQLEGHGITLEVVLIILGGMTFAHALRSTKLQPPLTRWLARVSREPGRRALLVVLGLTPFFESVTGFGVGVIMVAPILRQMRLPAQATGLLALIGLIAVPWGALGPGTLVAAELTGHGFQEMGVATAKASLPIFLTAALTAIRVASPPGRRLRLLPDALLIALCLWGSIYGINVGLGTPLAGVLGSALTVLLFAGWLYLRERALPPLSPAVFASLLPYAALVVLLLAARSIHVLGFAPAWQRFLAGPSLWLLLTSLVVWRLRRGQGMRRATASGGALLKAVGKRWWPVAVTTWSFLALGTVMQVSGMADTLAATAAQLGPLYLLLLPWIGGLGGFLTGSNTGSNAMFAPAQAEVARLLGVPALDAVAVQNAAASAMTMVSGSRIAVAQALLKDGRQDGRLFRSVLPVTAIMLCTLSVYAFLL